jgi:four helix bundle suffix protein
MAHREETMDMPEGRVGGPGRTAQTDRTDLNKERLRPSGGYRKLRSFQTAAIIYEGTVAFCRRFVDPRSRTHDQMVQAARSGKQNIAEGSRAGATSSRSEVHLTNVARASLDELLLDYEDFLRQRKLPQWAKDCPEARAVRELGRRRPDPTDRTDRTDPSELRRPYANWLEHQDPGVVANTLICLIHQASYLLDRQVAALERAIVHGGGYREQLTAARLAERQRKASTPADRTDPSGGTDRSDQALPPTCPQCREPMIQRTVRQGKNTGSRFWGCSGYPGCKGTRPWKGAEAPKRIDPTERTDPTDRSDRNQAPLRSRRHASD